MAAIMPPFPAIEGRLQRCSHLLFYVLVLECSYSWCWLPYQLRACCMGASLLLHVTLRLTAAAAAAAAGLCPRAM